MQVPESFVVHSDSLIALGLAGNLGFFAQASHLLAPWSLLAPVVPERAEQREEEGSDDAETDEIEKDTLVPRDNVLVCVGVRRP